MHTRGPFRGVTGGRHYLHQVLSVLMAHWRKLPFYPSVYCATANHRRNENIEEAQLAKQSKELADAWVKFQRSLPEDHQEKIPTSPPSIDVLLDAVETARSKRTQALSTTKLGKTKQGFEKVCKSLDNHDSLMAMIPSGDKYICLLTGSLSAIVKVCISH